MAQKVAVITGGASGIGQAVAQALVARGGWQVHVVDVRADGGELPPNTFYHQADTTNYQQLAGAIGDSFKAGGNRLDFLFANAGILERADWFSTSENPDEPPSEPDWGAMDINLKGCMSTVRIGHHYMRLSPEKGSIAMTSSSAGIWPTYACPVYTASKHGVVGFMRSIADWYHTSDGIRVNALCPSTVKTGIVPEGGWDKFPNDVFTPFEVVTKVILMFIDGDLIEDSNGKKATKNFGQAVVPSVEKIYLSDMPGHCDPVHRSMVESTHVENLRSIFS